jgi:S-adenosyl-L-methionine hydrolase (adenosine-forming)
MSRRVITLTTDFGMGSPYVAEMKGVILSIHPEVVMVDISHQVAPQDVRQAALILDQAAWRFPDGTIHVCVVDPGVGTDRRIVFAHLGSQYFIAPDNGILSRLMGRDELRRALVLTEPNLWLHPVSDTFHGRDIMAPVAARVAAGQPLEHLGPATDRLVMLDWSEPEMRGAEIHGQVLSVDSFGNVITNISHDLVDRLGSSAAICVRCAGHTIRGVVRTYGQRDPGTLVALIGSSGLLEMAVVQGHAAQRLRVESGAAVTVSCV